MSSPALVSLTFDDGFRCQFDRAIPILNSHHLPATFFLIANRDETHDRWAGHTSDWWKINWCEDDVAMLKQFVREGHEIGSHSVTHNPHIMPNQADIEARDSKRMIEEWIDTEVTSFCYPFYRSHAYLATAVRNAGYEQARGGGSSPSYRPNASHYTIGQNEGLDRLNIDCREISKSENVSGWVRPGRWHVLTFHGIGQEKDGWAPISDEEFSRQIKELATLRDSNTVEVLTFKNGVKRACGTPV
jgi:peptidoglycan/xylan/chitin deacetylase (PgdA/CDA1 family)